MRRLNRPPGGLALAVAAAALAALAAGAGAAGAGRSLQQLNTGVWPSYLPSFYGGNLGVSPTMVGIWNSVDELEFDSLPREFINQNGITFADLSAGLQLIRFRKGKVEDSATGNGYYVQYTCDQLNAGSYVATRYSEAQDRFLVEYGVVYKRAVGKKGTQAYEGYYNIFFVRDTATTAVQAAALKLDEAASAADSQTKTPFGAASLCGWAGIGQSNG